MSQPCSSSACSRSSQSSSQRAIMLRMTSRFSAYNTTRTTAIQSFFHKMTHDCFSCGSGVLSGPESVSLLIIEHSLRWFGHREHKDDISWIKRYESDSQNIRKEHEELVLSMIWKAFVYPQTGFPLFWKKKIPGVFQSNFRIFQVFSVIARNRISNTFGPQ